MRLAGRLRATACSVLPTCRAAAAAQTPTRAAAGAPGAPLRKQVGGQQVPAGDSDCCCTHTVAERQARQARHAAPHGPAANRTIVARQRAVIRARPLRPRRSRRGRLHCHPTPDAQACVRTSTCRAVEGRHRGRRWRRGRWQSATGQAGAAAAHRRGLLIPPRASASWDSGEGRRGARESVGAACWGLGTR